MAKFRGRIRHSDLEGGHLQLEGEDGTRYVLDGGPFGPGDDGAEVEIDGRIDKQVLSFAMTGPTLVVKSGKRV